MELKECLRLRRDTRHFTNDPVPDNILEEALSAAHMAPSVGLSEPWRFVVIKNDETKRNIKSISKTLAPMLKPLKIWIRKV